MILKIEARDENINIKYKVTGFIVRIRIQKAIEYDNLVFFFSQNVTLTGGGGGVKSGNTTQNTAVVWP